MKDGVKRKTVTGGGTIQTNEKPPEQHAAQATSYVGSTSYGTDGSVLVQLGGDLSGTMPTPKVVNVHSGAQQLGIGNIADGQYVMRLGDSLVGSTPVTPSIPTSLPPNGSASGDLGGSYPGPSVLAITTSAGVRYPIKPLTTGQALICTSTGISSQAFPTTATPTGSAGGDLSGNYPSPQVAKLSFSAGVTLTLGAIADGQVAKRVGSTLVGTTLSTQFDVTLSAPNNWWRASNVVATSGNVDTITDSGSTPRNFTASGTDRCTVGTDTESVAYLNMATALYQAGIASNWTYLHDGTSDYTIAIVFAKPSWPANSNTPQTLLASKTDPSNGMGMVLAAGVNASGTSGLGSGSFWGFEARQTDACNMTVGRPTPAPTTKQVVMWRHNRTRCDVQYGATGGQNGTSIDAFFSELWLNGAIIGKQNVVSGTVQTAAAAQPLCLGAFSNRAGPFVGRVYEIIIWKKRLTNAEMLGYSMDAASRYTFSLTG